MDAEVVPPSFPTTNPMIMRLNANSRITPLYLAPMFCDNHFIQEPLATGDAHEAGKSV
jgi:hypothetical protein